MNWIGGGIFAVVVLGGVWWLFGIVHDYTMDKTDKN